MIRENRPAVLLLEDGTVFSGKSCGVIGSSSGEITFNTSMSGYQEVCTDPGNYAQVLLMTNPHIGGYGIHKDEYESEKATITGLIVKNFSDTMSRVSAEETLQDLLVRDKVVGISDIDTRALTRYIRKNGVMNCIISSDESDINVLKEKLKRTPKSAGLEMSSKVSCTQAYTQGNESASQRIAVLDLGVKNSTLTSLTDRDCYLKIFPMQSSKDEILNFSPDGILISSGPGDPAVMKDTIRLVGELIESGIPVFGINLGHQLIGLSQGLKTEQMSVGHRGTNHPVKNIISGKGEITVQNHGFVITKESADASDRVEITHLHLNDNSVAGIRVKGKKVFSVQFHPEAGTNSHYLLDDFIQSVKTGSKKEAKTI